MLVTGATGFVGSHLSQLGPEAGIEVIRASRRPAPGALRCDLTDPGSIVSCLRSANPDLVVNAAGSASVPASFEDPEGFRAVNAQGVGSLLASVAAEAPAAHVLLLSTAQVYGEAGAADLPFREDSPRRPVTPYGAGKAEMETIAERARADGTRIAVARLFNQVGPGLPSVQAASGFAREVAQSELDGAGRVELAVGNLEAARDFTDVRDTARALLELSTRGLEGAYNVCTGRPTGLGALIEVLAEASELPIEIRRDASLRRPADPQVSYGDPARLREAIGWQPRIPLDRSLLDLLEWWRRRLADTA